MTERDIILSGVPSKTTGYLHSVILPRPGLRSGDTVPRIKFMRRGLTIEEDHLAAFRRGCGDAESADLPFDYPLTLLFHYHLAIFAHRDFPWSLRTLLGVRNHVVQRRRIKTSERLDLEVGTIGQRVLPKGIEFDIHSVFSSEGAPAWESISVYYLRGRAGGADARPAVELLQPLDPVHSEIRWQAPAGGGFDFARLSGDFNPVHYLAPWARRLGFKRDFSHTQRMVSDCLRRLPDAEALLQAPRLRLDVAFKGPVYYGSPLTLKTAQKPDGVRFDLYCGEVDKPAIPGNLRNVAADERLRPET
ncbi:MAG: hypothetical protein ACJ8KA_05030 [Sulfurifustis sp.]